MRTAVGGVHVGEVEVRELGGDDAALLVVVLNRQPVLHAQRLLPVVCHTQLAVCNQWQGRSVANPLPAHLGVHAALQTSRAVSRGGVKLEQTKLSVEQHL